jgi:opacity protein-like surface antigen
VQARLTAALAVLALALAGAAAAATSPAQYRAQAAAICRQTTVALGKIESPTSKTDFNRFLKDAVPVFQRQYDRLRKLSPPKALRALHTKALAREKQQLDGIRAAIAELDRGADPRKTFNAMDEKLSPIGDAEDAAWRKLKVPACANVGG